VPLNNPRPGPNYVPEYQVSGIPFVTKSIGHEVQDSPIKLEFPHVTQWVVIRNLANSGSDMRVGFTSNGVQGGGGISGSYSAGDAEGPQTNAQSRNYFIVPGNTQTPRMHLRMKDLYFIRDGSANSTFTVIAGLTTVHRELFPVLTGSDGFEGVG
jgi:hypothetical protein